MSRIKNLHYIHTAISFICSALALALVMPPAGWHGSSAIAGQIYSFVDENGVYHYSNVPTDPRYTSFGNSVSKAAGQARPIPRNTKSRKPDRAHYAHRIESTELKKAVNQAARMHGLDPALVKAIIEVESGGRIDAVSSKGAVGLMQLMPETARELGVADRTDAHQNIKGGTEYLKSLLERFRGDVILALAAYNAGPSAVEKYQGLPPYLETVRYVRKVLEAWNRYRLSERGTN